VGRGGARGAVGPRSMTVAYHEAILAPTQQALLPRLAAIATAQGYYLAGGTAIALHLGHRESVDFDFFAEAPAVRGAGIQALLGAAFADVEATSVGEGTWNGLIDRVKVSFFVYPYALLDPLHRWAHRGLDLASLRDLAAMKLAAVAQRGHRKDFIDLDFLLARGTRLTEMVAWYRAKYHLADVMALRTGLAYFDDAEAQPDPRMLAPYSFEAAKHRVLRAARELG